MDIKIDNILSILGDEFIFETATVDKDKSNLTFKYRPLINIQNTNNPYHFGYPIINKQIIEPLLNEVENLSFVNKVTFTTGMGTYIYVQTGENTTEYVLK